MGTGNKQTKNINSIVPMAEEDNIVVMDWSIRRSSHYSQRTKTINPIFYHNNFSKPWYLLNRAPKVCATHVHKGYTKNIQTKMELSKSLRVTLTPKDTMHRK